MYHKRLVSYVRLWRWDLFCLYKVIDITSCAIRKIYNWVWHTSSGHTQIQGSNSGVALDPTGDTWPLTERPAEDSARAYSICDFNIITLGPFTWFWSVAITRICGRSQKTRVWEDLQLCWSCPFSHQLIASNRMIGRDILLQCNNPISLRPWNW